MPLPYICNFRMLIHVYDKFKDSWHGSWETLYLETWYDGFVLDPHLTKDQLKRLKILKSIDSPKGKRFPMFKENARWGRDEIIECDSLVTELLEDTIKPPTRGDFYYEICGKYHMMTFEHPNTPNGPAEWDSENEFEDVKFQRVYAQDVKTFCKMHDIKLR